jgi:hypothetical protein
LLLDAAIRSGVFSSAVQQTLRAVVLRESGIYYTVLHEEEKSFLKHDATPTICPARWGSRRRYLKDVTNLKEHLPNVIKIRFCFNFEGMFLACAKRHYVVLALHAIHRASIDVTNSALSGRFFLQICK